MKPKDLFRYGCTNLFRRKTRTALTALSMAVGVMCIVVLISVGLGYEQAYRESIEAMGSLTKIDVTPATSDYGRKALLNDKALEAFRGIDGVEAVTPVYQQSAYIVSGNYVNMVRVYGIDMTTAESFMLTPERGTMAEDGTHLHPEVMFTDDVAAGLANKAKDWALAVDEDGNALIDLLEVPVRMTFDSSSLTGEPKADTDGRALPSSNLYTLRVTGICSTLNNNFATAAFMPYDRLQEMTQANANYLGAATQAKTAEEKANGPTYDLVWVKVKNVNDVQRIVKLIRDTGLNTYSLNDMLETVRTQSRQIQGMLGALGGIAVLISAICVANTMMMSITERTREIGVLKVLGTIRGDIFKMFLTEALIVGVIGGAAGLILSFIAKWLIPVIFASQELRCVLPWWLAVCGVLFAGAVAIAAAWMPARKATLISPNEAIRSEWGNDMKKICCTILAVLCILCLAGCGKHTSDNEVMYAEIEENLSSPCALVLKYKDTSFTVASITERSLAEDTFTIRYQASAAIPASEDISNVYITAMFNGNALYVDNELVGTLSPIILQLDFENGPHDFYVDSSDGGRHYDVMISRPS